MVRVYAWVLRCQIRNVLPHASFPRGEFVEPTAEEVRLAAEGLDVFDHVVHTCPETGLPLAKPQAPKVWAQKITKHLDNAVFAALSAAGLVTEAPDPESPSSAEADAGLTVSLSGAQTVHGDTLPGNPTTTRG